VPRSMAPSSRARLGLRAVQVHHRSALNPTYPCYSGVCHPAPKPKRAPYKVQKRSAAFEWPSESLRTSLEILGLLEGLVDVLLDAHTRTRVIDAVGVYLACKGGRPYHSHPCSAIGPWFGFVRLEHRNDDGADRKVYRHVIRRIVPPVAPVSVPRVISVPDPVV